MALTIVADATIKTILGEKLSDMVSGNANLVFLELSPMRSRFNGLNDALELAPTGQPVLMLAFVGSAHLAADRRFQLALSYPNVRFEPLPLGAEEIALILKAMQTGMVKPDNPLIRKVFALPRLRGDELAGIMHDLGHAQAATEGSARRNEMDARWIPRAKELFGQNLDREALIAAARNCGQVPNDYAPLHGQRFNVTVCDVEGTLIQTDDRINQSLLAELLQESDRPVVLWTGGDYTAVDKKLRAAGIDLPLIPKGVMRGATVALAIDDESPDLFVMYGVEAETYRQI